MVMAAVVLDDPTTLSPDLLERANAFASEYRRAKDVDELLDAIPAFKCLVADTTTFLARHRVSVFHATKELEPGYFRRHGLRRLDLDAHWQWFLGVVRERAPHMERRFEAARTLWNAPFYGQQLSGREKRVCVTFTLSGLAAAASGIWRLVTFFGGEAIFWPVHEDAEWADCTTVLRELGAPVIVEAAVPAVDVSTSDEHLFAKTILGHCARQHSPAFNAVENEGFVPRDVHPSEIIAVHDARAVCPDAFD